MSIERYEVLLDATAIPADQGGVGRYVVELARALGRSGTACAVVCQARDVDLFRTTGVSLVVSAPRVAERVAGRLIWEQLGLPILARRIRAKVVHSPHYTFPLLRQRARVVTVHDLTFFTMPHLHSRLKTVFFRWWVCAAARRNVVAVTPSQATADDFIDLAHASAETIVVAPHGYDASVFTEPDQESVKQFAARHSAPAAGWIAFLGTLEPRKNVSSLVRAYSRLVAGMPISDRPALFLAGGDGWDTDVPSVIAAAKQAGCDVRKLGYLPLRELPALLGGARCVVYPSLGEGFGLPVLEAMACAACVITTSRPALPEVGGDAVLYAEPDTESLERALERVFHHPETVAPYRDRARTRAAQFSWDDSAALHLQAYEHARGGDR